MDVLDQISPYNTHRGRPDPAATAVLVIDMQRFFSDIGASIVPNVARIVAAARGAGRPVVYTRHGHRDLAVDGGVLAPWWDYKLSMVGTQDWQIMHDLVPQTSDLVIDKTRYSAFFGTNLEEELRSLGIRDLVICGVMTNCCCETTAREAFMRDYNVFVSADATATLNEDLHISSLKGMAYACAHVRDTTTLVGALG